MITPRTIFTEDHDLFREAVRDFIEAEIAPHHARWEKQKMVDKEAWRKIGEMGFLGIQIPEEYGGMGITDYRYNAIIMEEFMIPGWSGPGLGMPLHTDIVIPYILHYANEETKHKYLPKMISGEWIGAIAMTEPGAGSDLQGMRSTAADQGDHFLLNGSKTFITNGYISDVVVVAAKTDPTLGAKGISLFVIDTSMEGFSKGKPFEKIGLHAQDTCELFFEDVKVPKENMLGGAGQGFAYLMTELAQERLMVAIGGLAAAKGAVQATVRYVKERKAFGKQIAEFQNTRYKLAELVTEVDMAQQWLDSLVLLHNKKELDGTMASMAKYRMTDLQCAVIDECVQLHGGYGCMWEFPVARAWADARAQRIYAGTNEIMKELISRAVLR